MKNFFALILLMTTFNLVHAQGSLQFNQVLIISNSQVTVPAGKVWKVTSVYGAENMCVDRQNAENATWTWRKMYITNFYVNGVEVNSSEVDYQSRNWCTSGCSSCIINWPNDKRDRPANPNILPFWLPAGATLQSGGPNVFLSLVEFNIIP